MSDAYLLKLPVELFHRIFDYCDVHTILSVRRVCKQFYAVASTYDRFKLNLNSNSKSNLKIIARLVPPENIISLTFSIGTPRNNYSEHFSLEKNPINSFISFFDVCRFTRLRSITFRQITGMDIEKLSQHLNINFLVSLSIDSCEKESTKTLAFLSSAITQRTIRKLSLNNSSYLLDHISWPIQCTLEHVRMDICVYGQYFTILHQLTHLQTFVMDDCKMNESSNKIVSSAYSPALSCLVINKCSLSMEDLELLLSQTPTLSYLKLSSCDRIVDSMFDGYNWEQFIRTKLHLLNKFELFLSYIDETNDDNNSLNSLIAPFRTPFWLNDKRWFIICDYLFESEMIRLYTTSSIAAESNSSMRCAISTIDGVCRLIRPSTGNANVDKVFITVYSIYLFVTSYQTLFTLNFDYKIMGGKGEKHLWNALRNNKV
jgi:hypothetical protein